MNVLPKLIHILQYAEQHKAETVEMPVSSLRLIAVRLYELGDQMEMDPEVQAPTTQAIAQPTGDVCQTCGGMLVQTGKCRTCQSCGTSDGGCS
jgi:hypothetical protein